METDSEGKCALLSTLQQNARTRESQRVKKKKCVGVEECGMLVLAYWKIPIALFLPMYGLVEVKNCLY